MVRKRVVKRVSKTNKTFKRNYLPWIIAIVAVVLATLLFYALREGVFFSPEVGIQSTPGNINACQELNTPGTYTLTKNLNNSDIPLGGCFNITSSDVVLDCSGYSISNDTSENFAITATGVSRVTIKNCNVSIGLGSWAGGVLFDSVTGSYVQDSTFVGVYPVALVHSQQNEVRNLTVSGGGYGIYLDSSNNNEIDRINQSFGAYGIALTTSSGNRISNSHISHNSYGLWLYLYSSRNIIHDISFDSNLNGDINLQLALLNSIYLYPRYATYIIGDISENTFYTLIDSCQSLNTSGKYGISGSFNPGVGVTNDICINISSSDIDFDCQGYSISNDGAFTGSVFSASGLSNISIRNCNVSFRSSLNNANLIYFAGVNDSSIVNSTFSGTDHAVLLYALSGSGNYNNVISNSKITNAFRAGLQINHGNNITISNSESQAGMVGFTVSTSDKINITNFTCGIVRSSTTSNITYTNIIGKVESTVDNGISLTNIIDSTASESYSVSLVGTSSASLSSVYPFSLSIVDKNPIEYGSFSTLHLLTGNFNPDTGLAFTNKGVYVNPSSSFSVPANLSICYYSNITSGATVLKNGYTCSDCVNTTALPPYLGSNECAEFLITSGGNYSIGQDYSKSPYLLGRDATGNHNGWINGGVDVVDGKLGNAAKFDGSTGSLEFSIPIAAEYPLTVSFWAKPLEIDGEAILFETDYFGTVALSYGSWISGASSMGWAFASALDNQWQYVTAVFENSTSTKIYLNGVISDSINNLIFFGGNFYSLGARGGSSYFYNGSLDEFSIWNGTLSDSEISYLYNSGNGRELVGNESGLIALYHFGAIQPSSPPTQNNGNVGGGGGGGGGTPYVNRPNATTVVTDNNNGGGYTQFNDSTSTSTSTANASTNNPAVENSNIGKIILWSVIVAIVVLLVIVLIIVFIRMKNSSSPYSDPIYKNEPTPADKPQGLEAAKAILKDGSNQLR